MTSCCIHTCLNSKYAPRNRVSFHRFPRDQRYRRLWLEALALPTMPKIHRAVCSDHFTEADYHDTKTGSRCLNATAIPSVKLPASDAELTLRVCKVCLAMDVKMYPLKDTKLHTMYEDVTGVIVCEEKGLQGMCRECATQLSAAAGFKKKAQLTDRLLNNLLRETNSLKLRDIVTLKRKYDLKVNVALQRLIDIDEIINPKSSIESGMAVAETNERMETDIQNVDTNLPVIQSDGPGLSGIQCDKIYIPVIQSEPGIIAKQSDKPGIIAKQSDKSEKNAIQSDKSEKNAIQSDKSGIIAVQDDETDLTAIRNDESHRDKNKPVLLCDESGRSTERVKSFKSSNVNLRPMQEVGIHDNGVSEDILSKTQFKNDITNNKRTGNTSLKDKVPTQKVRERKKNKVGNKVRCHPIDEDMFAITKLTNEEHLERIKRRAESARFKAGKHKCYLCFKSFMSQDKLTLHALRHSEQRGAHECSVCKNRYKTAGMALSHYKQLHAVEYCCKLCPFITTKRWTVYNHMKYHKGITYTCEHCNREFGKLTSYLGHLRMKHLSDCVCEMCGYTFINMHGVEIHKRLIHPLDLNKAMEGPYCEICDVQFMSEAAHKRHLGLSSKHINEQHPSRLSNNPFYDKLIDPSERDPRRPCVRAKRPPNPVSCEQCSAILPDFPSYRRHFQVKHPGINRTKYPVPDAAHMCDQCGKIFMGKLALSYHMTVHTGNKPFQCDHCNKTFAQKVNLSSHLKVHDVCRLKYECHVCGNTFSTANNRKRHMMLHTGLKLHECNACEKCFVTPGELRVHVDHVHLKKPRRKRTKKRVKKNDILSVKTENRFV